MWVTIFDLVANFYSLKKRCWGQVLLFDISEGVLRQILLTVE